MGLLPSRTQESLQRIIGKLRRVKRSWREPAKRRRQRFGRNAIKRAYLPAFDSLGEQRRAGDGSGAAATEEANFANSAVINDSSELQHITTNGVTDLDLRGRAGKLTHIPRILKVLQQHGSEHGKSITAPSLVMQSSGPDYRRAPQSNLPADIRNLNGQ
jgi:hypothetical protein